MSGDRRVSLRVIAGGRGRRPRPGLLVVGAAEVVTLAGGLRAGAARARSTGCGRGRAAGPTARRPGRRRLGGPDRSPSAARPTCRAAARGARATPSGGSRGSTRPAGRSRPGSSIPTPTCCSPAAARASSSCASAAPATSRSSRPAAGSSRPSPRRARRAPTSWRAHGRRWLDEMLGHGVTTVEAKSGYGLDLQTELRLLEVAHRLGAEGPIEVVPTWLGAHAVPPEFRDRPGRRRGLRPRAPRGAAAGRRGPGPGVAARRLLRGGRLHAPTSRGGSSRRPRRTGCGRGSMPTSWRRAVARSWPRRSGPRPPTTSRRRPRRGSTRWPQRPPDGRPGRRDAPARRRPGS